MARKVSFSAMESRSARLNKFTIRRRPYSGPSLARGILLLYRRNKTNGTWVLKVSDGHGAYWTTRRRLRRCRRQDRVDVPPGAGTGEETGTRAVMATPAPPRSRSMVR
jgi:hypothetical protein